MKNQNLVRGLFLIAVALFFGIEALNYNIGQLRRSGPGLFPLIISGMLLMIGITVVIRSRFVEAAPLNFNWKNLGIILLSLCGFALCSLYLDMIAGIIFLVFCSTFAGTSYSVSRNIKISAGLIAIAIFFQKVLGLNLPLF